MKKRIISLCLVLAMCLALLPTVALAGDGEVTTADDLTAAITNGGTVKLGGNIELTDTLNITKDLTLDLNGYTLTANKGVLAGGDKNRVNLTINDSSATGGKLIATGLYILSPGESQEGYGIRIFGNLTVNGGTVEAKGNDISYGEDCPDNDSKGIRVYGILTVNGGNVTGTGGIVNGYNSCWSCGIEAMSISVTSGSVTGNGGVAENSYGICASLGSLTVTGGTVKGTYASDATYAGAIYANMVTSLSISGGTFNGKLGVYLSGSECTSSLSGGTFNDGVSIINNTSSSTKYYLDFLLADGYRYQVGDDYTDGADVTTLGGSGTPVTVGLPYTVTFNYNYDGASEATTQTVLKGQKATDPGNPTRDGYTFGGWYEKDGDEFKNEPWDFEKDTVTGAVTLYAKWESETTEEENPNGLPFAWLIPGGLAGASDLTNPTFGDVSRGAYYYNAAQWAYDKGVAGGVDSRHFAPDESCTRAQAVTMLWRAAGCPDIWGENPFVDVDASDYYYKAVLWAVANGITSGTDENHFSPDEPCTRGQIVTFLHRAARCYVTHDNFGFTDVKTGSYCEDAINWAVENAITNGTGVDTFSPDAPCTRAQIVTFLYRNR